MHRYIVPDVRAPHLVRRAILHPLSSIFAFLLLVATWPAAAQPADTLLTLEEALEMAEARSYDVRLARNDAALAANDYSLGNAGYLPSAGVQARQGSGGVNHDVDVGATASYTVFDGFGRRHRYRQLRAERDVAEASLDLTTDFTQADVVVAYYALVRSQQQLDVLRGAIAISQERLDIAELRLELGSAAEQEVRRARVALNEDRAALLQQQTALAESKASFNQLLGRRASLAYAVIDTIHVDPTLALERLEARAVDQNPALRLNASAVEVAGYERRAIQSERFPRIDVTAGYTPNELLGAAPRTTNLGGGLFYGFTATLDVFDGFNRRRRIQNAELRLRNRELLLDEARTQVLNDLAAAFAQYENSLELVALQRENRDLAAQNVDVALESFRVGTITSVELREVQNALTRAESQLLEARFSAKAAETELRRLSGGI